MNAAAQRSEQLAVGLHFGLGPLLGLAVAPTVSYYLGAAGYATRIDLSPLSRYLFWALVGLIAFGIVLVFVHIPGGALIYSVAGLVIFAGWTLFDFQRLRRNRDIREAPILAASIFLDVLNVFLLFLSLFGRKRLGASAVTTMTSTRTLLRSSPSLRQPPRRPSAPRGGRRQRLTTPSCCSCDGTRARPLRKRRPRQRSLKPAPKISAPASATIASVAPSKAINA